MQTTFLSAYRHLTTKRPTLSGLWLLHGDDPLVIDFLIEAMRPLFKDNQQVIKRLTPSATDTLTSAIGELSNLSLFGEHTALIVAGKNDKQAIPALEAFAQMPSGHCLIYILPKQDKKAQKHKLFLTFVKYGTVVDCHYTERERHAIIQEKADEFNVQLTKDSWQLLLGATENNLYSAYQMLWQLSLSFDEVISPAQIMEVMAPAAQYTVFDLGEALLLGDAKRCLTILNILHANNVAQSLVLWAISKELHTLLELKHKDPETLGIWQSKLPLYQQAKARVDAGLLGQLFDIDCLIKGVKRGDAWQALTHLCLKICRPTV